MIAVFINCSFLLRAYWGFISSEAGVRLAEIILKKEIIKANMEVYIIRAIKLAPESPTKSCVKLSVCASKKPNITASILAITNIMGVD